MVDINFIYAPFSLTTGLRSGQFVIFVKYQDDAGRSTVITAQADDIGTAKRMIDSQINAFRGTKMFEPIVNIPTEFIPATDMVVFKKYADDKDSGIWRVGNDGNKLSLWYSKRPPDQQTVDEPVDTTTTTTQTDQDSGTAQPAQQTTAFNPFTPFIQFIEFINNLIRGTLPRQ